MFTVASSTAGQLLTVNFSHRVSPSEMAVCMAEIKRHLLALKAGFRMLTDLTGLVRMGAGCILPLRRLMDAVSRSGVSAIHRVLPDPQKDLGLALMSPFHHGRQVRIIAHADTADALPSLRPAAAANPKGRS